MLMKSLSRVLAVSLLISYILLSAPDPGSDGEVLAAPEGAELQDARATSRGNEWFVSETGTGTKCSRTNPGPLEYCVEQKAQSGDTVYVREGTYQAIGSDDNLLYIQRSLHLVGSCTWGATGPVRCYVEKLPAPNPTSCLDGNNQQRVIAIQGPDISVSIEGFKIENGIADHKEPEPGGSILGAGGGVYAFNVEELVLKNNKFYGNQASTTGTSAAEYGYGGGVCAFAVKNLDISENYFLYNSASSPDSSGLGGALAVSFCGDGGQVTIHSNYIHQNMVGDENTYSRGGGAFLSHVVNLDLSDNSFHNQHSTLHHFWIAGSALALGQNVHASRIDNNFFNENYGKTIVDIQGLTGSLTRNTFYKDECEILLNITGDSEIEIVNNFSYYLVRSIPDPTTFIDISKEGGTPIVRIVNNSISSGHYGIRVDAYAEVDIYRNILADLKTQAIYINCGNSSFDVNENLFWNNANNGITGTTFWEEDPKLKYLWNGNLHLQSGSGAIDKVPLGTVTSDIDYQPRPIGTMVDLGADEYGATIFMPLVKR